MDFPGLNYKAMSDEELMKKISELHGKLNAAMALGSADMIQQMQWMLETLQFEQSERAAKRAWDYAAKRQPDVIETDPDLVEKKTDSDTPSKRKKAGVSSSGSLLKRSRTPNAGTTDI